MFCARQRQAHQERVHGGGHPKFGTGREGEKKNKGAAFFGTVGFQQTTNANNKKPAPPTSLLLHLSPAALAAALAAALPPRLIEYLQRESTLTHLAKSAALDGVSRERLLNPYDGRTAGFAALRWGGITRACVFFCQDKSEPNRIAGGWLL